MYENASTVEVLAAALYVAFLSVVPVSSRMVGVPPVVTTVTASSNDTCTVIVSPLPYVPLGMEEVTLCASGAMPSTTMALPLASEPAPPGAGSWQLIEMSSLSDTR